MFTNYYQIQLQYSPVLAEYSLEIFTMGWIRVGPSVGTIFPEEDFLPSSVRWRNQVGEGGWEGLNYTDREQIIIPVKEIIFASIEVVLTGGPSGVRTTSWSLLGVTCQPCEESVEPRPGKHQTLHHSSSGHWLSGKFFPSNIFTVLEDFSLR